MGIKNYASYFTCKIFTRRFRHPRYIKKGELSSCYNPEYAEVQEIMRKFGYVYGNIIYFKDFIIENDEFKKKYCTLIITDISVFVCHGIQKELINIELRNLKDCNIHIIDKVNSTFLMIYKMKNEDSLYIPTKDLLLCTEVFYILRDFIKTKE